MSHRPELPTVINVPRFRIDGNHSAARIWPDIWFAVLIRGEAPSRHSAARVSENPYELLCPRYPAFHVLRIVVVGTSFRPVHLQIRKGILYAAHPFRFAGIAVPRHRVRILA